MKGEGEKIPVLTAYDYTMAKILDEAGVPIILIGDSAGMVFAGYKNTLSVTMDEIRYHTRAVANGTKNAMIVADMPFLSYQTSVEDAKRNAGLLVQEGAEAVKLEGGVVVADTISAIIDMGVPVMGHIGLTPQAIHRMGGYKVQGKEKKQRKRLFDDARAVEKAGAFSVVLEGMPSDLAREITEAISLPTIGIGAGPHCDGQVLVIHDILGLYDNIKPRFIKRYANLKELISSAVNVYVEDVKKGRFPGKEHSF
ncbi:MAG: 3-methyl-2-oxobutanoate hydroxymethyltransferase [Deltaproteobacteria bacterium RIFCSPLOWO2_12_FULL_43_16]|nr:MAG: 3-methyl-2-oxobutanoate hydroxymethyltransferase [Deltaproteobacteria bacterium GWA2_43_19]OGQ09822.1 MAG: 3-methyl-2-oxobutanoate hydroxymethyltransferase [Deltaproteobacteria bacterium RIFCSPHIGHO2_02_FULL_43_33]OGQ35156.1 MAG: 3-methyl-2-oxobutanoate hydroxymethyltransferase [Deltaproteobacteria bacterium RIFCSPLOWO2_01_FULL_42_9]OGQ58345.1 MAG: 3-methyl-2-oxobutanoate hydroxymethyltransferase [Deltaproteobacteria bacterium RIFCSPLOWO2_12_FULL_43_16]HBR18016.1 3-methyl-2-oxobutanoate